MPLYLAALARSPRAIDVAAQVPHAALRAYVMGERAHERDADADEVAAMSRLAENRTMVELFRPLEEGLIKEGATRNLQAVRELPVRERTIVVLGERLGLQARRQDRGQQKGGGHEEAGNEATSLESFHGGKSPGKPHDAVPAGSTPWAGTDTNAEAEDGPTAPEAPPPSQAATAASQSPRVDSERASISNARGSLGNAAGVAPR